MVAWGVADARIKAEAAMLYDLARELYIMEFEPPAGIHRMKTPGFWIVSDGADGADRP